MVYYCWLPMHVKITLFNWSMERPPEITLLPQGWNGTPLAELSMIAFGTRDSYTPSTWNHSRFSRASRTL
jgi:hypothetical protein